MREAPEIQSNVMELFRSSWSFNTKYDSGSFAVKPWVEVTSPSQGACRIFAGTSIGLSLYDQCRRLQSRTL